MTLADALTIVGTAVVSIGGAGAIIFGLSAWLGKVWADRLMATETANHAKDLETLRSEHQASLERSSLAYRQKLDLYRQVADPLVDLLVEVELKGQCKPDTMALFEKRRLNMTATLGMFASSSVFNAYNDLVDYMFDTLEGKHPQSFPDFRVRALRLLTEIRRDVGMHTDELIYKGTR
jgi:hypothetical protein